MCFDCGYGTCVPNSTRCQCHPPYIQSLEMWVYEDIPCDETDLMKCLPCDVRRDVLEHLYLTAGIVTLTATIMVISTLVFKRKKWIHAIVIGWLLSSTVAVALHIADTSGGIGSNVWNTALFLCIAWLLVLSSVLDHRRHLRYIFRAVSFSPDSGSTKRIKLAIYLNNCVPAVVFLLSGVPIIAFLYEVRDKTLYLRIYLFGMVFVFLHLLLMTIFAYKKPLEDIRKLQDRCKGTDPTLRSARRRIQALRIGSLLILVPFLFLHLFTVFYDPMYRFMIYLFPVLQIITCSTFVCYFAFQVVAAKSTSGRMSTMLRKLRLSSDAATVNEGSSYNLSTHL